MSKKPSKQKFYRKLFFGGLAVILFVVFLINGCDINIWNFGWSFRLGLF